MKRTSLSVDSLSNKDRDSALLTDSLVKAALERRKMTWLTTPPSLFGKRIRYAILEYEKLLDSCDLVMSGNYLIIM